MSHPDEGTIHAWLDGALPAAEAAAFEARLAADPTLQAAVAEARGLIAASSRILGALDAVPGNVVPKPRSLHEGVASIEAARAQANARQAGTAAPRRWSAQRWAAAAMLVVAVGAGVLWQSGGAPATPENLAVAQAMRSAPAVSGPLAAESAAASVSPAASGAIASGRGASGAASAAPPAAAPRAPLASPAIVRSPEEKVDAAGFAAKRLAASEPLDAVTKESADRVGQGKLEGSLGAPAPMAKAAAQGVSARDRAAVAADEVRQNTSVAGDLKARAEVLAAAQRGVRQVPTSAILEERIPDPRASAIGCRAVQLGAWAPAAVGVRSQVTLMLDSQRVAVGWRRVRFVSEGDARYYAPGTWIVEGDTARIGLPDVGDGQPLRAAISLRTGTGVATLHGADAAVHSRAAASWAAAACVPR